VVDLNFFSAIAQLQPSMLKIGERKDKLEIWSLQIPSSQRIQARNCVFAFFEHHQSIQHG
jgi:hypothetical protein